MASAAAEMVRSSRFVCSLSLGFFLILIDQPLAFAQPKFLRHFCIDRGNNDTAHDHSGYKANLDHLLSTLTTDHRNDYGFYNFSYGQHNKANVIGLCRGDVIPEACRRCLNYSTSLLRIRCPNQKEAIGWYDDCMLRYSDRSLFGLREDKPFFYLWNVNNASDQERFNRAARNLVEKLIGEAASGGSRLKFSSGNTTAPNLPTIYGVAQCTPDLSHQECNGCLLGALSQIRECCDGKQGGRVVRPSCHFRYESYSLIQSPPPSQRPPPPPPPPLLVPNTEGSKSGTSRTVIVVVVPIVVTVVVGVLMISICIFLRRRNPRIKCPAEDEIAEVEYLQFDFNAIRIATDEFSDANKLGEGGFGAVYKGRLANGQNIAVKRLSQVSNQGDDEFKNEVRLVSKLHHRNLVHLLGFSLKDNEKLLIYEFAQNSSLEKFIFDPLKSAILDWKMRYKIIGGIVRGLVYLHEDSRIRIIHRDLKASNILLDAEMNAKIADFGTARLFMSEQMQRDTNTVIGTYGYMAPEYVRHGHFSVKSDVFSFGVLVLEIVSGKKTNQIHSNEDIEDHLISKAWRNWREGTPLNIVDHSIQSGSRTEIIRCIHIGLLCIQEKVVDRPTMATILLMLNSYSIDLPRPTQPCFVVNSSTQSNRSNSQLPSELGSNEFEGNSIQESFTDLYPR